MGKETDQLLFNSSVKIRKILVRQSIQQGPGRLKGNMLLLNLGKQNSNPIFPEERGRALASQTDDEVLLSV